MKIFRKKIEFHDKSMPDYIIASEFTLRFAIGSCVYGDINGASTESYIIDKETLYKHYRQCDSDKWRSPYGNIH